jgi:hypothetical protein
MEFKGTKGKWVNTMGTFETDLNMVSSDYGVICDIRKELPINEQKANALLISKAPEMLEMLKDLVQNNELLKESSYIKAWKLIKESTELKSE